MPTTRPLALRFVWGQLQGGVLPLQRGRSILVGRQQDSDLVIADDLVSRRHARLAFEGEELVVEDLGSTNGTYLNGARVTRARVLEGDRLLVGGSIMKVVADDRPGAEAAARPPEKATRAMQGSIEDVPLRDLLQLFATGRRSGVLVIERAGHEAELQVDKGCLVGCVIDGRTDLSARKGLTRLLAWSQGHFELRRETPAAVPGGPAPAPLEQLLAECVRQLEELRRLFPKLPRRFTVAPGSGEGLDEGDRALLALAAQRGSLDGILDATPLTDLEAVQRIGVLLARGSLKGSS
jgi:pSer/pThr/pTyr-binding forkhead associated (FHA) protein